ncbi:MAG: disulfide bond formation protein DsbA [Proteobacteria bacterium]|nr:disulfide bond formation protein DsbA [Pseudomonadota bacterium]
MDRRKFVGLGVGGLALLGLGGPLVAAVTAGKEYVALAQPLAVETGDKIEVTEFFWYGCPHCFDLEPLIGKWLKTLPKDVEFRRVPAIFRESWVPGAKTYWMASKGIDRKKFVEAYNSFNVQTKVKRAEQLTRQSKIQGVPALIIDGKYMTSGSLTGSHEAMLAATDELIQKARSERKKK